MIIIVIKERKRSNTEADMWSYKNNFLYERLEEYHDIIDNLGT